MTFYPIFLDVREKPVLLVGGGHVALEKIGKLVDHGAAVTVVAPELIPDVRAYIDDGRARLLERPVEAGDTVGYFLVMVATDNGRVNREVADEARSRGILVNAADDAENCDFILPALVRRSDFAVAASTGGSSPAMARWLRERLEEFLSDDVVALGELLADVRIEARARDRECASRCTLADMPPPLCCDECPNKVPADAWQTAIDEELRALVARGERDAARALLVSRLQLDGSLTEPASWGPVRA